MVDTVKFNVGGKHFEVSRALIDANPNSMLAKMISETWEKDPENPMFIDRDGYKFAHVLDYLRYGSIELPATVPQAMFQRELDYYSIEAADGTVTQTKKRTLSELMNDITEQKRDNNEKEKSMALAVACFDRFQERFKKGESSNFHFFLDSYKDGRDLFDLYSKKELSLRLKTLMNEYLDHFGLVVEVENHVTTRHCNKFTVSVKK